MLARQKSRIAADMKLTFTVDGPLVRRVLGG